MKRSSALLLVLILAFHPAVFSQGTSGRSGAVAGTVREEGTNTLLQGVTLDILSSGSQLKPSLSSGMSGEFSFGRVPAGDYSIVAKKDGYETSTTKVMVFPGGAQPVVILLRKVGPNTEMGSAGATSVHELSIPQKAREAFEKGRKLLEEEGQPAESIPEFQKAIQAYPSYYEAYTEIGVANYSLRNPRDAEEALKKAVQLSSQKYLKPLYLLSDLYNGQQRYAEAEPLARQAAELENSDWHGHFELARALVGLKRGVEAEASASKCRDLKPDNAPVYLVLANAHMLQQNYSAVVQDFDSYLKLEPTGLLSDNVRQRRDRLQNELQHAPEKKDTAPH
jgi:Flp pilus assembly protein TadD